MIIKKLHGILFGTLRRQLIVGVAVVHALMMALFIGDLTLRNKILLLERQTEQATALAHTLATSSAGWLAAHDLSGLQELAESQRRYPELQFAILLDNQGQILAHTNRIYIGQYLQDLPVITQQTTLGRSPALVDVIVPAMIADQHVGWARVGISQHLARQKLAAITHDGILYAIVAIVVGSACAWLLGSRITRRLSIIQTSMDEVRSGNSQARALLEGSDEAADLSNGFNTMLDTMAGLNSELSNSEKRFRSLFENSPVSIWEEDFSTVKQMLDSLKEEGVNDIEAHLNQHPELLRQCTDAVRIIDINLATLHLHEATSKKELLDRLSKTFTPESYSAFGRELVALWHGETKLVQDTVVKTLNDTLRNVTICFSVAPESEKTFSRIMVSLIDITERKRAEEALSRLNEELEQRIAREVEENRAKDHIMAHQTRLSGMGEMLSNIAHQWRQPLNNISIIIQNLQLEYEDGVLSTTTCRAYIQECMTILTYMSRTINNFSSFYQPAYDRQSFNLYPVLDDTIQLVRPDLESRGITIHLSKKADSTVNGYPKEFAQTLQNIIQNAKEVLLTKCPSDPYITIVCSQSDEMALVTIKDNGGGISPEILDKVFDPYFTSKFKSQGVGMGLYLSKMIIENNMNGKIFVANSDEGTEVSIELPLETVSSFRQKQA